MSHIEKNNIRNLLDEEKKLKIKYTDFLIQKYGKNVCIVYLNKMAEICSNKDIFEYLFIKTDLFKRVMIKEMDEVHHCIDNLEHFITICENPIVFMKLIDSLSSSEIYKYNRFYSEMIKKVKYNKNSQNIIYEGNSFKNIINLLSFASENSSYIIEIEGIFNIFLNIDNEDILEIFYKNYYTIVKFISKIVDNFIKNNLYEICMDTVIRIMIKFILIGEKIKSKYNCKNCYIEEFRDIYKKIHFLKSDDALELKKYFITNFDH